MSVARTPTGAVLKPAGALAAMTALFLRDLRLAQRRKSDTLGAAFSR